MNILPCSSVYNLRPERKLPVFLALHAKMAAPSRELDQGKEEHGPSLKDCCMAYTRGLISGEKQMTLSNS